MAAAAACLNLALVDDSLQVGKANPVPFTAACLPARCSFGAQSPQTSERNHNLLGKRVLWVAARYASAVGLAGRAVLGGAVCGCWW